MAISFAKTSAAETKRLMPLRSSDSYKGQNGRVGIIGGSREFFGAPILSALGALGMGADLVTLFVPSCNFDVTRSYYADFLVADYQGTYLTAAALPVITSHLERLDALVIGPGLGYRDETVDVIHSFLQSPAVQKLSVVLDADAIHAVPVNHPQLVITPHAHEFANVSRQTVPVLPQERIALVKAQAMAWGCTVLFKSPVDIVANKEGDVVLNETGNAGMTVGGTGDVLAGMVAGLLSQKTEPFAAAQIAAYVSGATGDRLLKTKGYGFTATDVALSLAEVVHNL